MPNQIMRIIFIFVNVVTFFIEPLCKKTSLSPQNSTTVQYYYIYYTSPRFLVLPTPL